MIPDVVAAWAASIFFAALGALSLIALVRSSTWSDRISYLAHTLMSASMTIMPWGWSLSVPAILQVTVFTAAALWYLGLAVLQPRTAAGPEGAGHRHHLGYLVYHAAMMSAMVWMALLMTLMMGGSTSGMTDGHMDHMPGMIDRGPSTASMTTLWQQPPGVIVITLAFVVMFIGAVIWFLVDLIRSPLTAARSAPLPATAQALLNLLMAAGMATSFLIMG